MAKLSKSQRKLHDQAVELLKKDTLTDDERMFVLENWHEGANHINGAAGAFFTPLDLAWDLALEAIGQGSGSPEIIDICAGIGVLSYCIVKRCPGVKLVCVDVNPEYVEIGKKLVPEAEWYCLDICDIESVRELGSFDVAVSNPPYGKVPSLRSMTSLQYTGAESEYKVMELAASLATESVFLIPQGSANFRYSDTYCYKEQLPNKLKRFLDQTSLEMDIGLAIDTAAYSDFKDVKITTEIVCVYNEQYQEKFLSPVLLESTAQFDLFAHVA